MVLSSIWFMLNTQILLLTNSEAPPKRYRDNWALRQLGRKTIAQLPNCRATFKNTNIVEQILKRHYSPSTWLHLYNPVVFSSPLISFIIIFYPLSYCPIHSAAHHKTDWFKKCLYNSSCLMWSLFDLFSIAMNNYSWLMLSQIPG
jgi:hypothetical protein